MANTKIKLTALSALSAIAIAPTLAIVTSCNKKVDDTKQADIDPQYKQAYTTSNGYTYYPITLAKAWTNTHTLDVKVQTVDSKKYTAKVEDVACVENETTAYVVMSFTPGPGVEPATGDTIKFNMDLTCSDSTANAVLWTSKIEDVSAVWGLTSADIDKDFDGLPENLDPDDNDNEVAGIMANDVTLPFSFKMDYRNIFNAAGLGLDATLKNKWNDDLAKLASILADHVHGPNHIKNVKNMIFDPAKPESLYKQFGCEDYQKIEVKASDVDVDKNDTVVAEIAHHKMYNPYDLESDKPYQIVFLSVRGTVAGSEWISDFDIGSKEDSYMTPTGSHPDWENKDNIKGCDVAASRLWHKIFDNNGYLKSIGIDLDTDDHVIFFNTGHSRGGAISNIIGARLEDYLDKNYTHARTMSYCFATPNDTNITSKREAGSKAPDAYETVHCVISDDDVIGKLPFEMWNMTKYGKTHTCKIGSVPENKAKYEKLWKDVDPTHAKEYVYYDFWLDNVEELPVKDRDVIYELIDETIQYSSDYDTQEAAQAVIDKDIVVFEDKLHVHQGWYEFKVVDGASEGKYRIQSRVAGGALIDMVSNIFGPDKEEIDIAALAVGLTYFTSYGGYIFPLIANIALAYLEGIDPGDVGDIDHSMCSYYFCADNMPEDQK